MAGSGTYCIAAVDALRRLVKRPCPQCGRYLSAIHPKEGYSDGRRFWDSATTAKAALLKIDATCQSLLPYLRLLTEDAHRVRDAVELLEACHGQEARTLGAETRTRWRLR